MMSSKTARTSGSACAYSISRTVVMAARSLFPARPRGGRGHRGAHPDIGFHVEAPPPAAANSHEVEAAGHDVAAALGKGEPGPLFPRRQRRLYSHRPPRK